MINTSHEGALRGLGSVLKGLERRMHLQVSRCHNIRITPEWHVRPRVIEDFHLFMVRDGACTLFGMGEKIALTRGRLFLTTPRFPYEVAPDLTALPHFLSVRFSCFRNDSGRLAHNGVKPFAVVHDPDALAVYEDLLIAFVAQAERERDEGGDVRFSTAVLHHVLGRLWRDFRAALESGGEDARLETVRRYMAENPLARDEVAALAAHADLSERYFARLFLRQYGVTPKAYQVRMRLQYARQLLQETGTSVKDVAYALGYADPFAFSRQFKDVFGISPSSCRS